MNTTHVDEFSKSPAKTAADSTTDSHVMSPEELTHHIERRFRWRWNMPVLISSTVATLVFLALATGSYYYHHSRTADTFLSLAKTAGDEEDFVAQSKWLRRYSLLNGNDVDAIYDMAVANNKAADRALPSKRAQLFNSARRSLSQAIGRLRTPAAESDPVNVQRATELRKLLIRRLLQLGGPWNREAEQQLIALNAPENDPLALTWMAQALTAQVNDGSFDQREAGAVLRKKGFWGWLRNQQVGYVVAEAMKRNPSSLDLAVSFLATSKSHPSHFASLDRFESVSAKEFVGLTEQAVKTLADTPSSRSQLALYQVLRQRDKEEEAERVLAAAAITSQERLSELADSQEVVPPVVEPQLNDSINPASPQYWDYLTVFEHARLASEAGPEQSLELYQLLLSVELETIPGQLIEDVYLASGNLKLKLEDSDAAIAMWRKGLERSAANSVNLLRAIARAQINEDNFAEASKTLASLDSAIEKATIRLSRTAPGEMLQSDRTALGRRLKAAQWESDVLQGLAAKADGRRQTAIALLSSALISDTEVETARRVNVSITLAAMLGEEGLWDQAAEALEQATQLAPSNQRLRMLAANAWSRSGNRLQAIQQWRAINSDGSRELQLSSLEARFQYQLRLLPAQRNFDDVRNDMQQLVNDINDDIRAGGSGTEESLLPTLRYLQALQIMVPAEGVNLDQHLTAAATANRVEQLALESPEDARLQAFAAERLAQAGLREPALRMLKRFGELGGTDTDGFVVTEAQVMATLGDPERAAEMLMERAASTPSLEAKYLQMAIAYASRADNPELAFEAGTRIPEDQHSTSTLFATATFAKQLPQDSKLLVGDGKSLTSAQQYERWLDKLRKHEGDKGSHWRFLEVGVLLGELMREKDSIDLSDKRLIKAKTIVREILAIRPRWGQAISLEGWISVLEGKPEKAVAQLKRGISAGDRRLQSRRILWEQLIALGRGEEAENEILTAALASDSDSMSFALTRVGLAMREGNFQKSMRVVQELASEQPDNIDAHLVVAATGTSSLRLIQDGEKRAATAAQTSQAIEAARALADPSDQRVYEAALQLALMLGDEERINAETEKIKASSISEVEKLRLVGRASIVLRDNEQALVALRRVDEIEGSARSKLALANVLRVLRQFDEEIDALRAAQQLDPSNSGLRDRLARTLVSRAQTGQPVDWNELSSLLSTGGQVTSANRLTHATLLGMEGLKLLSQGSAQAKQPAKASPEGSKKLNQDGRTKLREAQTILRRLVDSRSRNSDGASRLLAALLDRQLALKDIGMTADESKLASNEVRTLFESLTNRGNPSAVDLYGYASFLLNREDPRDVPKVERLLEQLTRQSGQTLQCLEVAVRLAGRKGQQDNLPNVVSDWVTQATESEKVNAQDPQQAMAIYAAAGTSLLKLGFADDSLPWLEKTYQLRPETFVTYALALRQAGRVEDGIEVCAKHFRKHNEPKAATLCLEMLLSLKDIERQKELVRENKELVDDSLEQHADDAALMESVGTLRMAGGDFVGAIEIYEKVLTQNPASIRVLNNIAMAYSEIPGKEKEGLPAIETALKLTNENPELLDTKGVVLMASGDLQAAEDTFAKAYLASQDPRHHFHWVMSLLKQGRDQDAQKKWRRLDLSKLDLRGLTASERELLQQMRQKFGQS